MSLKPSLQIGVRLKLVFPMGQRVAVVPNIVTRYYPILLNWIFVSLRHPVSVLSGLEIPLICNTHLLHVLLFFCPGIHCWGLSVEALRFYWGLNQLEFFEGFSDSTQNSSLVGNMWSTKLKTPSVEQGSATHFLCVILPQTFSEVRYATVKEGKTPMFSLKAKLTGGQHLTVY